MLQAWFDRACSWMELESASYHPHSLALTLAAIIGMLVSFLFLLTTNSNLKVSPLHNTPDK
jgi:hypothetical protein